MRSAIHFAHGSSPLARGLPRRHLHLQRGDRIIPARAGFTCYPEDVLSASGDHPRSRGVYRLHHEDRVESEGSSPLARGLLVDVSRQGQHARIIPARAGFTSASGAWKTSTPDHPRSRGVYGDSSENRLSLLGSSPLARGLHDGRPLTVAPPRIIPARAGFTLADPWNPNDEPCYQTAFTFSADLEPAPPSSGSAVVLRRSTMTPSEA